ncbi:hypothetical protein BKA70DRAFT_1095564 [Coprinopsis sp. MPI-PUGE-AT-0042]|nr:hypothetical protein BKA70DRAFT_1095564 [Coprinopsis sp. MPI-PUGE-AT-0042]
MTSVVFNDRLQTQLPLELVESLNQVYFLHLLATEPDRVIPPGKSLLSMLLHSRLSSTKRDQDDAQPLLERVKEAAHRAFWDEAVESLASPEPAVQLPRLKRLYEDLADALEPLLPTSHPMVLTLRSPLAPTTSPLHSTLLVLKDLLASLKERCAPVRDEDINKVYQALDEWNYSSPSAFQSSRSIPSALASCIVDAAKTIIHLTELMKSDLDTAVLGSLPESQVKGLILQKAKEEERDFVLRQWTTESEPGGQVLRRKWRSWLAELPEPIAASYGPVPQVEEARWVLRLMACLESDTPVSCNLPLFAASQSREEPPDNLLNGNELPPHFLLASRKLFYIQNYIQAIAVAAALQVLSGLPTVRQTDQNHQSQEPRFMERVWTLLRMEVEAEEMNRETADQPTKLINLSDEVIQARRLVSPGWVDKNEEVRIRDSVDRTLRPRDPVFILLRRRLVESVGRELVKQLISPGSGRPPQIPAVMRTGRGLTSPTEKTSKRSRLQFSEQESLTPYGLSEGTSPSFSVKGFEDPVLVKAISENFVKILGCIHWVSGVWGDLV